MLKFKKALCISSSQIQPRRPPPGLAFLAGLCEENNLPYEAIDLNIFILDYVGNNKWLELYHYTALYSKKDKNTDLENLIDEILDKFIDYLATFQADLALLTVLSYWQNHWCQKLLEKIKEKKLDLTTVVGGPGVSVPVDDNKSFGKFLAENKIVDYYIIGEGDVVLKEFLNGDIVLGINGQDDKFETRAIQIDNLDSLAFPSYKKIDVARYKSNNGSGEIAITGSRGCVRRCTFCDVAKTWKKFRFRSAKNIVHEIEKHYLETGETNFAFTDSLINGSVKNFIDFMQGLVDIQTKYPDLQKLKYSGQFIIRPKNQHPEYMYELMAKTGFQNIQIGVESGSEQVRYHMQKKFSNEDIDYHMEMCNKYKLGNTLLLLLGYPTETIEDFNDTLNMIRKYQKYMLNGTLIDVSDSSPLVLLKDTPLYEMAEDLGIDIDVYKEYYNLNWISSKNPDLTVKERWQRFVLFQRELIRLGYPRPAEQEVVLEQYLENIKLLKDKTYVN